MTSDESCNIWWNTHTRTHTHTHTQECPVLTTSQGIPIDDKTNSITVGPRGPMLMQDTVYMDEMASFDRERIPERVVHAKGAGERLSVYIDTMKYSIASCMVIWSMSADVQDCTKCAHFRLFICVFRCLWCL